MYGSRLHFSAYVQFITGHNFMRRHQAIVVHGWPDMDDAWCSYCDYGEESSFHMLTECDYFARLRVDLFNDIYLEPPYGFNPRAVVAFLGESGLEAFSDFFPEMYAAPSP